MSDEEGLIRFVGEMERELVALQEERARMMRAQFPDGVPLVPLPWHRHVRGWAREKVRDARTATARRIAPWLEEPW